MHQKAMSKDKIHLTVLSEQLAHQAGISRKAAEEFLKLLSETIEETLLNRESVKIKGLGTFKLQWNEPRKSVDVNTGAEIVIEGYHKVTFAPEASLKDAVNEPYAHLETVVLDIENVLEKPSVAEEETKGQSFDYFSEQASEIKGILSEIDALHKEPEVSVEVESKTEEPVVEIHDIEPEIVPEKQEEENEIIKSGVPTELVDEQSKFEQEELIEIAEPHQDEILNANEDSEIKPVKGKPKMLVPMLLLGMVIGAALFYLLSTLDVFSDIQFKFEPADKIEVFVPQAEIVDLPEEIAFEEEEIPLVEAEPVDTLQLLFDEVREFTEFIATERVIPGSRLTRIAERHYGEKLFWVFIYEANRAVISNPEDIQVGTELRIPKLNPMLADMSNERCVEYMRNLQKKYLKR